MRRRHGTELAAALLAHEVSNILTPGKALAQLALAKPEDRELTSKLYSGDEEMRIKQEILLAILDIIEKHGAEVAFPTRTVHIPDMIAGQGRDTEGATSA